MSHLRQKHLEILIIKEWHFNSGVYNIKIHYIGNCYSFYFKENNHVELYS